MGIKLTNNANATLAASIDSSATSITLTSGQGARFPTLAGGDYFYATLVDTSNNLEIVKCTARSTDVLTVVRAQESTTARAYNTGDRIEIRITAQTFADATTATPAQVSDQANTSTGYFDVPTGTTAQRPGSPTSGAIRFNTDTGSLEFYDGTTWIQTNLIPVVNSVTGTIYAGAASTLTLSVSNSTDTITVRFAEGGSVLADVTGVAVSAGSASVSVPAAVYGQTAGDTISVSIINQDGTPSSNAVTKTVQGLPTGGTITTYSGYRAHAFTSSGSFVVPSGFSATAEYLIVAGGGAGGSRIGGGGGAGGMITGSTTISAQTYTVTVGGGGAGVLQDSNLTGGSGGNSSALGQTSTGGGGGGSGDDNSSGEGYGVSGGSGGGGAWRNAGLSTGGSGTSGQGSAGGTSWPRTDSHGGGGGGGKSAAGANATSSVGGNGGNGATNNYRTGSNETYAGGGGGGVLSTSFTAGSGGSGGGGAGGNSSGGGGVAQFGTPGTANTGGGGGGASDGNTGTPSASGGSGIVIIRYPI